PRGLRGGPSVGGDPPPGYASPAGHRPARPVAAHYLHSVRQGDARAVPAAERWGPCSGWVPRAGGRRRPADGRAGLGADHYSAGDAHHLAPANGRRRAAWAIPDAAVRRRGAATGSSRGAALGWGQPLEPVRPHRDDDLFDGAADQGARRASADRSADREYRSVRPRRRLAARPGGGAGGIVYRWGWASQGLPGPARTHCGAV